MNIRKIRIIEKEKSITDKEKSRKLTDEEMKQLRSELYKEIKEIGVDAGISIENSSFISINGCKLTSEYADKYGRNTNGRMKTTILGWGDWVEVNNTINRVLDKWNISAMASSLNGYISIRDGQSWDDDYDGRDDNVGSYMSPVMREDAWSSVGIGRDGWRMDHIDQKHIESYVERIIKSIEDDTSIYDDYLLFIQRYGQYSDLLIQKCIDKNSVKSLELAEKIKAMFTVNIHEPHKRKSSDLTIML